MITLDHSKIMKFDSQEDANNTLLNICQSDCTLSLIYSNRENVWVIAATDKYGNTIGYWST